MRRGGGCGSSEEVRHCGLVVAGCYWWRMKGVWIMSWGCGAADDCLLRLMMRDEARGRVEEMLDAA
jgi:hypothetical protein